MDDVTQQNAALVEEAAAAAESLEDQARQMVGVVARFKLEEEQKAQAPAPPRKVTRSAAPPQQKGPEKKPRQYTGSRGKVCSAPRQAALAEAPDLDDDWKEF